MKRGFFYLLFAVLVVSCGPKFEKLESGYEFRSVEAHGGKQAKEGEALRVHMTIELDDSLVVDTRKFNPIGRRLAVNSFRPEFKDVVAKMGNGDSVQVKMNLYAYAKLEGRQAKHDDSTKTVVMSMRILDIKDENKMLDDMVSEQLSYEKGLIENYLVNNNLEAQQTEEGIYYIISREGEGEHVAEEDTVISNFTLRLLNGKVLTTTEAPVAREAGIFKESTKYDHYAFSLAKDRLLEGWIIGLPLLKEGGKGTFFIPSKFAFGSKSAAGVIPPNATVIYDIEVIELK